MRVVGVKEKQRSQNRHQKILHPISRPFVSFERPHSFQSSRYLPIVRRRMASSLRKGKHRQI